MSSPYRSPRTKDKTLIARLKRVAHGIDEITVAVWDESSLNVKIGILVVLILTGTAIPLIPIAVVARILAP